MRYVLAAAGLLLIAALPARADSVVMAAGDIACAPDDPTTSDECRDGQTANLLVDHDPDRVLTLGDNQYDEGQLREFRNAYDKTWGRVKNKTRSTAGNHEYRTEGAKGYFNYFGWRAGKPSKGYYSFSIEGWRLIALNSNKSTSRGSRQVEWLRRNLASHPAACTLAYFHHPLFSSGEHGNNPFMKPIYRVLNAAGTELVLTGHDHDYERFAPMNAGGQRRSNGIRAFVVGTGGANHRPFEDIQPRSRVRNANTFGVLKLTLQKGAYEWEFIPEAGGFFTDAGQDTCH